MTYIVLKAPLNFNQPTTSSAIYAADWLKRDGEVRKQQLTSFPYPAPHLEVGP